MSSSGLTSLPQRRKPRVEGDFFVYDDVALFDEHTGRDGVRYSREVLAGMAKTMNDRIADTGDYVPLADDHTPEPEDRARGARVPEVLGFAGPFKVQKFGKLKPRWCIFGTLRVLKHKLEDFLARPRRSVEVWPEPDPKEIRLRQPFLHRTEEF